MSKEWYEGQPQKGLLLFFFLSSFLGCNLFLIEPIPPRWHQQRDKVKPFLDKLCPDQAASIAKDDSLGAVAALYHVIRSGDDEAAYQAIIFAGQNGFGYGCPYAIERLENGDPKLREAAASYLKAIAGADYGPSAESWRAWWRDPPRNLFGLEIGQWTLRVETPILILLWGLILGAAASLAARKLLLHYFCLVALVLAWFQCLTVAFHWVAGLGTCTFGAETIKYWKTHGIVLGLEDANYYEDKVYVVVLAMIIWLLPVWTLFYFLNKYRPPKAAT
jgi:hypothetical protein